MYIIDGKQLAQEVKNQVKAKLKTYLETDGEGRVREAPRLAMIVVGNNPASTTYICNKKKALDELGFYYSEFSFDESVETHEILNQINSLNRNHCYDGIFVQLPLPAHLKEDEILNAIEPEKDVDGFHHTNKEALRVGKVTNRHHHIPCTVLGCHTLINHAASHLNWGGIEGTHVVIIGRSEIVGKPLAQLLSHHNCTVTVCHSKTSPETLKAVCQQADVIVSAVGKPKLVTVDMVKKGAIVIDVGINFIEFDGKRQMVGDVDFEEVKEIAGAITPVPGGVGQMTVAFLMSNLLNAYLK